MRQLRKFGAMLQTGLRVQLAYRGAVWFGIVTTLISITIYYALWNTIFKGTEVIKGFTFAQMVTYVILSRILSAQFSGGINRTLAEWIYDGRISTELLRPVGIMFSLFSQRMADFVGFLAMRALPSAVAAILLFGCLPPAGPLQLLLFLLSTLLSVVLMFFLEFMVGLLSFYTMNMYGVLFAKDAIFSVLSGGVVPLALFPQGMQDVLAFLPFPYLISLPVNLYLGTYAPAQIVQGLAAQMGWILLMALLALAFYNRAVKRVVIQGG